MKDAIILLNSVTVTWRMTGSQLIEIYTPSGVWEPCKLQLSFILQPLVAVDWNNQDLWEYHLARLVDFPKSRIGISADQGSLSGIRLAGVADLAIKAGETTGYTSGKLEGFTWSCALVAPISKLLEGECVQDISSPLKPLIPEMEILGLSAGVESS